MRAPSSTLATPTSLALDDEPSDEPKGVSPRKGDQASNAKSVFDAIREEGETELDRPLDSLFWSGLTAGGTMALSVLTTAVLLRYLPDAPWTHLVASLGYTVGFVVVVIGHMQLFTENTITTILPVLHRQSWRCLRRTAVLWSVVFLANLIGAAAVAGAMVIGVVPEDLMGEIVATSEHGTSGDFWVVFRLAIPAGFLVAAMVWITRLQREKTLLIVVLMWLIAVGGFKHCIAGAVETFVLVWTHGFSALALLYNFLLPAVLGNVVGGTLLFALLAWAQVRAER